MERRTDLDRRRVPRGGRRTTDRPGRYPAVLVADSYDSVRTACARYLQRFNFDVAEAADGEAALTSIVAGAPRLILTEWNLPAMPAGKLSQWIAQRRLNGEIPVIVLANAMEEGSVLPRAAAILRKPFTLSTMLSEVRRVLRAAAHE